MDDELESILLGVFLDDGRQQSTLRATGVIMGSICRGEVTVTRVDLPVVDDEKHGLLQKRFDGGAEHRELCAAAALWLDQSSRPWSAGPKDLWCPGGKADIRTIDGTLTVEAGCTRAQKVIKCFMEGIDVLLVPYGTPVVGILLTYHGPRKGCA
jgi:hypothetical protein